MLNPLKYFRNRSVGLALGSGGSKGIAHIAVIEYLESLDIPIHYIAGSSIGAVVGVIYSAGKLRQFREDLLSMQWREMVSLFDPVFPRTGLMEGRKLVHFLTNYISRSAKIEDLPVPVAVVATDYYSGYPLVFRSGNILDALRASVSIPGVFTPLRYNETFLLDGGVSNPIPIDVVKKMGAGLTVAVNLHPALTQKRLKHIVKKVIKRDSEEESKGLELIKEKTPPPVKDILGKRGAPWIRSIETWLGIGVEKMEEERLSTPNIFATISQAIDIMEYMNSTLILKYYRPTVLIQPDLGWLPTLDFSQTSRALTEGYNACSRMQGTIKRRISYWI
ncbi:MAG TPA: patatin-like phospholipase family protein [Spirochaetota bacterium]|nr:patatin-like phospholipase family protein [Spirochaetota bacterium]HPJ39984.1 patatin-like phospholipase family protein [Spirochaetota bacterium]HPQ53646.1 patatin-like phospholipase family protein [Spirochaetota bacterium]